MSKFDKDSLGDRMKSYEEIVTSTKLVPKMPIAIRVDGKAFHTFTKGFAKPFDELLSSVMQKTMVDVSKELNGCVFGYTQSDEITFILKLPDRRKSQEYLSRKLYKILSITASKTTKYFNKNFFEAVEKFEKDKSENTKMLKIYKKKLFSAEFDCRAFNIPEWEIINLLIWRQQDATRNSIQMLGQANFSQKQLQNKNCSNIMDMLVEEKGLNWNDMETRFKRGSCTYKVEVNKGSLTRKTWVLDNEMKILTEDRLWLELKSGISEKEL